MQFNGLGQRSVRGGIGGAGIEHSDAITGGSGQQARRGRRNRAAAVFFSSLMAKTSLNTLFQRSAEKGILK